MKTTDEIKKRYVKEQGAINKAKYAVREANHLGWTTLMFGMPVSKAEVDAGAEKQAAKKAEKAKARAEDKGKPVEPMAWDAGSFLALAVCGSVPAGVVGLFAGSWYVTLVTFLVACACLAGLLEWNRRTETAALKESRCSKSDDMLTLAGTDDATLTDDTKE